MYSEGYQIRFSENKEQTLRLRKWDFGGDKPWTNSIWNKELDSLKLIDQSNYPLTIIDLDNVNSEKKTLFNKSDLNIWISKTFK